MSANCDQRAGRRRPASTSRGVPSQGAPNRPPPRKEVAVPTTTPPTASTAEWLTVAEYAAALRVSTASVYRWIQAGELDALHLGRTIRIPRAAFTILHDHDQRATIAR